MKRTLAVFSLMLCLVFSAQTTYAANSFLPGLSLDGNLSAWGGTLTLEYIKIGPITLPVPTYTDHHQALDSVIPESGYYDITLAYIGSSNPLASNALSLLGNSAVDYLEGLLPEWVPTGSLFDSMRDFTDGIPSALSPESGKQYTSESVFLCSFLLDLMASALDYVPDYTFSFEGIELGLQLGISSYLYTGEEKEYEWNGVSMLVPTDTVFVGINIFAMDLFGVTIEQDMDIVLMLTRSSAVPIPGAVLLLGTGLGGIAALRRRMA